MPHTLKVNDNKASTVRSNMFLLVLLLEALNSALTSISISKLLLLSISSSIDLPSIRRKTSRPETAYNFKWQKSNTYNITKARYSY